MPLTSTGTDSWTGTPTDLTAFAQSGVILPENGVEVSVNSTTVASWAADGNSGILTKLWSWDAAGPATIETNQGFAAPDWYYSFTADATGTFDMDYSILASGATFGLYGINVQDDFDSVSGTLPTLDAFDPTQSGEFSGAVTAGNTYYIELVNNGNVTEGTGVNQSQNGQASLYATFDITPSTSAVPDNGTTALLVALGVGGAVVAVRRKRPV